MLAWDNVASKVLDLGKTLAGKWKTKGEQAEALQEYQLEMEKLFNSEVQGQLDINKIEARQKGFHNKWRPGSAWMCIIVITWSYLAIDNLNWAINTISLWVPKFSEIESLPAVGVDQLRMVWMYLVGLAGIRMGEKFKGTASG